MKLISQSQEILGGESVFYGTRVPIKTLIDYLETGDRLDDFLDDFPTVSRDLAVKLLEKAKNLLVYNDARSS